MWAKENWLGGDVRAAREVLDSAFVRNSERTNLAGDRQVRGGKWRIGCGTGIVGACADSRRYRKGNYYLSSSLGEYWDSLCDLPFP